MKRASMRRSMQQGKRCLLLSSMESIVQKRIASTALVWPILCARWIACISTAGFHHGSHRNTARRQNQQGTTQHISTTESEGKQCQRWRRFSFFCRTAVHMLPLQLSNKLRVAQPSPNVFICLPVAHRF